MSEVTVLIPTGLKHLSLLGRAIDSALAQTVPVKVIVANNSGEVVLPDRGNVTVVNVECKEGMTGAQKAAYSRNVALRQIDTPYTIFLDADDTLTRPATEVMLERLSKGDVDYVYGDWYAVNKQGARRRTADEFTSYRRLKHRNLHPITALVQTEQAIKCGGFDETLLYYEDWGFWIRMVLAGYTGVRVPYAIFSYYMDEGENRANGHELSQTIHIQAQAQYAKRFEELEKMACTSCGGNKNTPQMFVAEGSSGVLMEYLGKNEGSLSYKVPRTNRRYAAGNADGSRFIDAHPADVAWLEGSGLFRAVQAPSVPDVPYGVEQEAKGDNFAHPEGWEKFNVGSGRQVEWIRDDKLSKNPPAAITETEADSEFVMLPNGDDSGFHIPDAPAHEPTRKTRQPRKSTK